MKHISESLTHTNNIAKGILESLKAKDKATILALEGDLGSGKTAFTQEVGKILGVRENINSPTFVIEKIYDINYKGFTRLIHIDAYRLEKESELLHLGWEEIIKEPENLILIEWPDNVKGLIPEHAKPIKFQFIDEKTREINHE